MVAFFFYYLSIEYASLSFFKGDFCFKVGPLLLYMNRKKNNFDYVLYLKRPSNKLKIHTVCTIFIFLYIIKFLCMKTATHDGDFFVFIKTFQRLFHTPSWCYSYMIVMSLVIFRIIRGKQTIFLNSLKEFW